jgi:hypothetical protein
MLSLWKRMRIDKGRGQLALDANALAAPDLPGGDKLVLRIDAVPEQNQARHGMRIEAPGNGFVAKLAGLNQPLVATLGGHGTWADWRGQAKAVLGGKAFANLAVGAKDGTFTMSGPMNPALLMAAGPAKTLLSPQVQVNLTTKFDQRRADTRLRLNSPAMAIVADGIVDLGRNRFDNFKVAGRLSRPRAIGPNLDGTDIRLAMVLNGAFATPFVAYELRARTLSFNDMTLELLQARGRAKVDSDRISIPIQARARRISGLDPSLGSLLTNVAANGTINISGTRLVSDNLKIRSDRLNATVALAGDFARGQYRAGIQGTVNNYHMEGIGLLDLTTDMDVFTAANGFGLKGKVAVRTRRIDNPTAAGLLEGNATAAASVAMTPAGVITLDNVRLSSPGLRIASGGGTIWPDGRIDIRAAGVSRAYGPIAVVVTGTATRPQIALKAASPGFGIGLRDVTATVRAIAGGLCRHCDRPVRLRAVRGRRHHPLRPRAAHHRHTPPALRRNDVHRPGLADRGRTFRRNAGDDRRGAARDGPARRRRPLPARRHRRDGQRRPDTRRESDPDPARPHPRQRHPLSRRAAYRRRRPARRRAQQQLLPRPGAGQDRLSRRQRPRPGLRRGDERSAVPGGDQRGADAEPDPRRRSGAGQEHPLPARPAGADQQGGRRLAAGADRAGIAAGQRPAGRPLGQRHGDPVAAQRLRHLDIQRLLARPRPRRPRHR